MTFYNVIIIPTNEYKNYRSIRSSIYTTEENAIKGIIEYLKDFGTISEYEDIINEITSIQDIIEIFYEIINGYYIEVNNIKPDNFVSE
jgi:hypothetical protein